LLLLTGALTETPANAGAAVASATNSANLFMNRPLLLVD
jgi:hypothetical protein